AGASRLFAAFLAAGDGRAAASRLSRSAAALAFAGIAAVHPAAPAFRAAASRAEGGGGGGGIDGAPAGYAGANAGAGAGWADPLCTGRGARDGPRGGRPRRRERGSVGRGHSGRGWLGGAGHLAVQPGAAAASSPSRSAGPLRRFGRA